MPALPLYRKITPPHLAAERATQLASGIAREKSTVSKTSIITQYGSSESEFASNCVVTGEDRLAGGVQLTNADVPSTESSQALQHNAKQALILSCLSDANDVMDQKSSTPVAQGRKLRPHEQRPSTDELEAAKKKAQLKETIKAKLIEGLKEREELAEASAKTAASIRELKIKNIEEAKEQQKSWDTWPGDSIPPTDENGEKIRRPALRAIMQQLGSSGVTINSTAAQVNSAPESQQLLSQATETNVATPCQGSAMYHNQEPIMKVDAGAWKKFAEGNGRQHGAKTGVIGKRVTTSNHVSTPDRDVLTIQTHSQDGGSHGIPLKTILQTYDDPLTIEQNLITKATEKYLGEGKEEIEAKKIISEHPKLPEVPRSPFIPMNCSLDPEVLKEAEASKKAETSKSAGLSGSRWAIPISITGTTQSAGLSSGGGLLNQDAVTPTKSATKSSMVLRANAPSFLPNPVHDNGESPLPSTVTLEAKIKREESHTPASFSAPWEDAVQGGEWPSQSGALAPTSAAKQFTSADWKREASGSKIAKHTNVTVDQISTPAPLSSHSTTPKSPHRPSTPADELMTARTVQKIVEVALTTTTTTMAATTKTRRSEIPYPLKVEAAKQTNLHTTTLTISSPRAISCVSSSNTQEAFEKWAMMKFGN